MKPTMPSPGTGEQHLANRTRRSSTPLIRTAPSGFLAAFRAGLGSGPSSASWTTAGASLPRTCCTDVLPYPTDGQQIVRRGEAELGEELLHLLGREQRRRGQAVLLRLALEELAPEGERAGALLDLEPLVDLGARAGGLDELEPVAARVLGGRGDDLDDVALLQRVAQRHELAVDLGADAVVADVGVDGVGEVDRGRALAAAPSRRPSA